MKNYLDTYAVGRVRKFQMGGAMPAPQEAPVPEGGGEQGPDIEGMILQAYETQDPNLALEVVNILAEMSGMAGGGSPMEGAPKPAPEEEMLPMGRYGLKVPKIKRPVTKGK